VIRFDYGPAVVARFPTIRHSIVEVRDVTNGVAPRALADEYHAEQHMAAERARTDAIGQRPPIAAWRKVFRGFGSDPTQHRSAPEALLRRVAKHGDIPPINAAVDVGNLVSIREGLPVAVFDLDKLVGGITVTFAAGSESFDAIGASIVSRPDPGEVIFLDDGGTVLARRWCWRQSSAAAVTELTTSIVYVVEAHHRTAAIDVNDAASAIEDLLRQHLDPAEVQRR
jgi:DNA/RNA-binding domain of Phe-tRNA-synthetase-like protein